MNERGFIDFLKKLRRDAGGPIIVIADCASYHKSKGVREYCQANAAEVEVKLLPVRSPELNPDEQVWNQAKKTLGKMIIENKKEMKKQLLKVMRSIQKKAQLIKSFFKLPSTIYASCVS